MKKYFILVILICSVFLESKTHKSWLYKLFHPGYTNFTLHLPDYNTDNGIKWTCFPVLDTIYTPDAVASELLCNLLEDPYTSPLQKVEYKIGNSDKQSIYLLNNNGWNNDDHQFASVLGYKFKMKTDQEDNPNGYTLDVNGFLADPNTPIHLYENTQNWIGYFLEDSQTIENAFGEELFPHIQSVVTQRWFWKRPLPDPDDDGISDSKDRYTLNYGDMVIVVCDIDTVFHWNTGTPVEPRYKERTAYFTPNEKLDYVPVYVKTDKQTAKEDNSELGIFMEGVCIGASVINDTILDVPVYPVDSSKGEDNQIEFVIYNGGAKKKEVIKDYYVYDKTTMRMVKKSLDLSTGEDYYFVSLTDESTQAPKPEKITLRNYPNPFNPETTVRYSLPNDDKIELTVYNLKGQKVKRLIKGYQKAGYYKAVWNGKNEKGIKVASGVYFCRLKTSKKVITRKMLMLK